MLMIFVCDVAGKSLHVESDLFIVDHMWVSALEQKLPRDTAQKMSHREQDQQRLEI